jgi:membrane-associated protein
VAGWIRRHPWLTAIGCLAVVAVAALVLIHFGRHHDFSAIVESAGKWAYVIVFAFIVGDAVFPVLPGETALNAGATLAASGTLTLGGLIVAGWAGAVVGDSALFFIARKAGERIEPQIEQARSNDRVALALDLMGQNAPLLIVAGRYVPGLRFAVNAMMGLSHMPYRRFLPWSAIGGLLWSAYTCLLAYAIGTALQGYPLASIVISGVVTTVAITVILVVIVRRRRAQTPAA